MTCIVGLMEKGKVYMGGDSAGVGHYDVTIRAEPKVFRKALFVYGVCGSFRLINILHTKFVPPPIHTSNLYEYMATNFIDSLRSTLKDSGFASKDDEVESMGHGSFMVGMLGRLFHIGSDYQVGIPSDGYDAIGVADAYALGSLYGSKGTPRKRVLLALQAAEKFNGAVRSPFVIERV